MKTSTLLTAVIILLFLAQTNCYALTDPDNKPTLKNATDNAPVDVSFLQFNIWQEGTKVSNGVTYIKNVIINTQPDIVCFVEVRNYDGDWTAKMVDSLAAAGLTYHRGYISGADVSIISKYPITSSGPLLEGSISLFHINANGNNFVVAASHLDYTHYACYLPRGYNCGGDSPYDGWDQIGSPDPEPVTDIDIISEQNLGSQRDEQISAFVEHCKDETLPVILMGDFNEPSCLDWTSKQSNMFDHHNVGYEWNTTKTLKDNDYVDCFREIFPDEIANPGFTWPAVATGYGSTSWAPKADERDRIDYIFYKGENIVVRSAAIVGPKEAYVRNVASDDNTENETFLADDLPWPSDHKGVYATISIPYVEYDNGETGGQLIVNADKVPTGKYVIANYKIKGFTTGDKAAIYMESNTPGNGIAEYEIALSADSATIQLTNTLAAGDYKIYLLHSDNSNIIDPVSFSVIDATNRNWILGPSSMVFYTDKDDVNNTTIQIEYNDVTDISNDWIGVYPIAKDDYGGSTLWNYISSTKGTCTVSRDPHFDSHGLGLYKAALLDNDGYTPLTGYTYFYVIEENTNAISEVSEGTKLKIFPNPTSEKLSIEASEGELIYGISIFNLSGQKLIQQSFDGISSKTINTDKLESGLYLISVKTQSGFAIKKVTIKK